MLGRLRLERRAELGLAAGPLQEQHQPARDRECEVAAVVFLDERERQVHARTHARGAPELAVAHEDRIVLDADLRMALRERGARAPVRGRAPSVEQTGLGEQERARTHGSDAARGLRTPAQEVDQGSVVDRREGPVAARDHERVDRATRVGERPDDELDAGRRAQRAGLARDHAELVARSVPVAELVEPAVRVRENLERTGDVEHLHPGIDDHDDAHVGRMAGAPVGRNDKNPSLPAIRRSAAQLPASTRARRAAVSASRAGTPGTRVCNASASPCRRGSRCMW